MQEACKSNSDEVFSSSKPIILHKSKKSKHMLKPANYDVMLKCIAVVEPIPKFHWFKVIYNNPLSRYFIEIQRDVSLICLWMALMNEQDGVEIIPEKGNAEPKYSVRSIVLSEEDLTEVNEKEGMRSTLHIRHARGSDTANVSLYNSQLDFEKQQQTGFAA